VGEPGPDLGLPEDWFDYRLENDPSFIKRVESARSQIRAGQGRAYASRILRTEGDFDIR
jgi:hypothetical protein